VFVGRFRASSVVGDPQIISFFGWSLCFLSLVGLLVLFVCDGSSLLVGCLFVMYPVVCGVCVLSRDGEALDFGLVVVRL